MIIDCISDLHGYYPKLEGGDLLILAGDYTAKGTSSEYFIFCEWLKAQNYKKKVMIAGNHDMCIYNGNFYFNDEWMGATWLNDSGCEYEGLKIWGSPWSLWFSGINPRCTAFTGNEGHLKEKYDKIPYNTDILITHSPPYSALDEIENYSTGKIQNVGSVSLAESVRKIKPKLHVFGHIHEGYGKDSQSFYPTLCINASHVDRYYNPINNPIRIQL